MKVTYISKGIVHSPYGSPDYISERDIGRTHFFLITKVGTKFIYGHYLNYNEDGTEHKTEWEDKEPYEDFIWIEGIQHHIKQRKVKYNNELEAWEKAKHKADYDIDSEMYKLKREKQEAWLQANPIPKNDIKNYIF